MKKVIYILIIVIIAIFVLFVIRGDEDGWICDDGVWVEHGNPSAPMPTEGCGLDGDDPSEADEPVVVDETMAVEVYFANDILDPEVSCTKVFPVEREVPQTQAVARVALEELLKGVEANEATDGYVTSINDGVLIQSLTITNGVAEVDFNEQLEFQVGGSCRVGIIGRQIEETLLQFPTIDSVVISINGRTEDILQP